MPAPLRVANASGFYGDRLSAMREMLEDGLGGDGIDVLTGDYLAELTMLILGRDRLQEPGRRLREDVPAPARGEPRHGARQRACGSSRTPAGSTRPASPTPSASWHSGSGSPSGSRTSRATTCSRAPPSSGLGAPLTANAYLGAWGIAACLPAGADVVVTGRVTDASLVVGPAAAHFGWARDDLDALAGAVVAGHVIECGAQATGGNYAFFTELDAAAARLPDRRDRTPTARR